MASRGVIERTWDLFRRRRVSEVIYERAVFVIYASSDELACNEIVWKLERKGFRCWVKSRDIRPGADYQAAIVEALSASAIVLLLLSQALNVSMEAGKELALAATKKKQVLCARLEPSVPAGAIAYQLSNAKFYDLFTEEGLQELYRKISQIASSPEHLGLTREAPIPRREPILLTIPSQTGPGPTLAPTGSGFEVQLKSSLDASRLDPGQISLHQQLRQRTSSLKSPMLRLSNTHKALAEEFDSYCEFLAADLSDLDISSLWCVGAGLSAHVRALDRATSGVMTPELEPDIAARLRTLLATHAAFILGFPEGKEMHDRVIKAREAAEDNPALQAQTEAVLAPMDAKKYLLAERAHSIVRSLLQGLALAEASAFDLLASSADMTRNSLIAFMRVLHPIILSSEVVNVGLVFAGYENPEVLSAAAAFLRDNHDGIVAMFALDPQIMDWMSWGVKRLSNFDAK